MSEERQKKQRVETRPLAEVFLPDLDLFELKQLLKKNKISYAGVHRKVDLIRLLDPAVKEEKKQLQQQRIAAISDSAAAQSPATALGNSHAPAAVGVAAKRRGLLHLSNDIVIAMSQFLALRDVAAVARSTKVLNTLCSLKLKGDPSPALTRRQAISLTVRVSERKRIRVLLSLRCVRLLELQGGFTQQLWDAMKYALSSSAGTLRELRLSNLSNNDDLVERLVPAAFECKQLRTLELPGSYFRDTKPTAAPLTGLPHLRKLLVQHHGELGKQLIRAHPNLTELDAPGGCLDELTMKALPHLVRLTVRRPLVQFCMNVLRHLSQIRDLRFLDCGKDSMSTSGPVCLDKLKFLLIDQRLPAAADWRHLSMPTLSTLCVTGDEDFEVLGSVAPNVEEIFLAAGALPNQRATVHMCALAVRIDKPRFPAMWAVASVDKLRFPRLRLCAFYFDVMMPFKLKDEIEAARPGFRFEVNIERPYYHNPKWWQLWRE